jgi:hypothetical protein
MKVQNGCFNSVLYSATPSAMWSVRHQSEIIAMENIAIRENAQMETKNARSRISQPAENS